jgi:lambda family phage minor tail protein L
MAEESLINLYKLDLNPRNVPIIQYYHGEEAGEITFKGNVYKPISIKTEGFDRISGASPEPKIAFGNTNGLISSYIRRYGIRAAEITRTQTRAQYLPLPSAQQKVVGYEQTYSVNRPSKVTGISITLELRSILELQKIQIPGRKFYRDTCPWVFKDGDCGYRGTSFSNCPNTLAGCRARFGSGILPFGGFPLIDQFKA